MLVNSHGPQMNKNELIKRLSRTFEINGRLTWIKIRKVFHPWYQIYAQVSICSSAYQRNELNLSLKWTTKANRYLRPLSIKKYCPWLSFWRYKNAELTCGLHHLYQIQWSWNLWGHKHRVCDHWISLLEKEDLDPGKRVFSWPCTQTYICTELLHLCRTQPLRAANSLIQHIAFLSRLWVSTSGWH